MNKMLPLAVLLLAFPGVTCAQTEELSTQRVSSLGLEQRWSAQAVINSQRDKVKYVTNDVDNVYVQSSAGVVTTLNAEDGRVLWSSQIGASDEHAMAAISNNKLLMVVTGPVIHAIDKFTGDELFAYRLPVQPSASPGLDDSSIYVPLVDGSLGAFSINTLRHYERYGSLPPGVARTMAWRYICNETIRHAPVVGSQLIAFGTDLGNIHAASTASGATAGNSRFEFLMKSPISAPVTYFSRSSEEFLLTAAENNRVFCISLSNNGKMVWTYPMGRQITEPMPVFDEHILVTTEGGGLRMLSVVTGLPVEVRANGNRQWNVADIEKLLAVSKTRVFALDNANRILSINRETGSIEANVSTASFPISVRNLLTDRLYFANNSGQVVCLAEKGTAFATYHQNRGRQPIMPEGLNADPEPAAEPAPTP
ncbi:MAG: PQQ-binding-like beta-propeller repeat protein [Planctomyces sp.]|nr:PQQ-binding-like beta-propeller repeat protein [Planctomyces sp.]